MSRPRGTLEADPNPLLLAATHTAGAVRLTWTTDQVDSVEIRIGGPLGPVFACGGRQGTATTGPWVRDWMTFFLQDVSVGAAAGIGATLDTVCVRVHAESIGIDDAARAERSRLEALPAYTAATTTLLGGPFDLIDASSFLTMYDEIIVQGIYGFTGRRRPLRIVDCGANVGVSVAFFKQLDPTCRIVAFEPHAGAFAALERNVARRGWSDVVLVPKAVSGRDGLVPFRAEASYASRIARPGDQTGETVEACRLRPYLTEPVDLLKVNVEGAETEVLADCADLLATVDRIVVEYHAFTGERQTLDTLIGVLAAGGYRLYVRSVTPGWPLQPLVDRPVHEGMDLQLYVYAFREGLDGHD